MHAMYGVSGLSHYALQWQTNISIQASFMARSGAAVVRCQITNGEAVHNKDSPGTTAGGSLNQESETTKHTRQNTLATALWHFSDPT